MPVCLHTLKKNSRPLFCRVRMQRIGILSPQITMFKGRQVPRQKNPKQKAEKRAEYIYPSSHRMASYFHFEKEK